MIFKILRIQPIAEQEHKLERSIERLLVPLAQSSPDIVAIYPGNRLDDATGEVAVVTVWRAILRCVWRLARPYRPNIQHCRNRIPPPAGTC